MHDLCTDRNIAGSFFDADDVIYIFYKMSYSCRLDRTSCTARHIIKDRRDIDGVTNLCIVCDQTVLRRFVVVRCDKKKSVCTVFGCFLGKLDRCACRVGSCACDHRDTVVYTFNGKTDHFAVFLFGHCCRFSGRSADDDRICFSCNLFFE